MRKKYSKSEVSDLFTKLNSCIKEREASQKRFQNILSYHSGAINKGMNDLIDEVDYLQAQLAQMKNERDDLLLAVQKYCGEIRDLKPKKPHDPIVTGTKKNQLNAVIDCQDADIMQVEITKIESHYAEHILQERIGMTNMTEPRENTHMDTHDFNCQDSDINQKESPAKKVNNEKSLVQVSSTIENVTFNKENKVEEYICPHCHSLFSEAEHLNAHIQNTHSKLEVSPTGDVDIRAKDGNSGTEAAVNQELEPAKRKKLPKVRNHICVKSQRIDPALLQTLQQQEPGNHQPLRPRVPRRHGGHRPSHLGRQRPQSVHQE